MLLHMSGGVCTQKPAQRHHTPKVLRSNTKDGKRSEAKHQERKHFRRSKLLPQHRLSEKSEAGKATNLEGRLTIGGAKTTYGT